MPTRAALTALVGAQLLLLGWLTRDSWFFVDDFLFLAQAREEPFSLEFLRLPLFEHFSPVHRLFDYAFIRLFGLEWAPARLVLLGLVGMCILAFHGTAKALLNSPRLAFGLTAVYGTSLFFVRNVIWWTGGVHLFVFILSSLLCMSGYIRWYQERRPRWWLFSIGSYAVALLTYEQAMLVPAYLVLATWLLLAPEPRLAYVVREWRSWIVYASMTGAALLNYLTTYYLALDRPSPGEVVTFLRVSFFEGLLPTSLGLKVPEAVIVSQRFTVVLAALVAAGLVIASLRRNLRAARAWAFFLVSYLIATLPLGIGRIVTLGVEVGREPRYQLVSAFLLLLAAGAAFDPRYAGAAAPTWPRLLRRPGMPVALVVVLTTSYLAVHVRGATRVHGALWEAQGPKEFFTTFERQVDRVKDGDEAVHVFPGAVSESVMPPWLAPFNQHDHALVLAEPSVRVGQQRQAFVVEEDGRLNPAAFRADIAVNPAESEYRLTELEAGKSPERGALCASGLGPGQIRIPLSPNQGAEMVGVEYESSARQIAIFVEQDGRISELLPATRPAAGRAERYLDLPQGPVNAVAINVMGPGSLCLYSVELGNVLLQ